MSGDTPPPAIACSLTAAAYRERSAWIDELNRAALRRYRRDGSRIRLTYDRAAVSRVREFVRLERDCCPFLDFALQEREHTVVLTISAPPEAGAAADTLFESYTPGGGGCSK